MNLLIAITEQSPKITVKILISSLNLGYDPNPPKSIQIKVPKINKRIEIIANNI